MSSDRSEKDKMLAGEYYNANVPELIAERHRAKELCQRYAQDVASRGDQQQAILKELLGGLEGPAMIEPGFRCDYGSNIYLGKNFYANFDLIILDVCEVRIGDDCLCGPRVSILTAGHPVDPQERRSGLEFGKPISIGNNVWLGAGAIINPGVTIGDNAIVGSGAVVTHDVAANTVVAGIPARVIREI
ncbi:MAG: sugar O-acetyltransferase [Coraliomargarita sp.]